MEKKYYTCQEIADLYGVRKTTVWKWIREKKLPAVRPSKNYRIRSQDIEQFDAENNTRNEKEDSAERDKTEN